MLFNTKNEYTEYFQRALDDETSRRQVLADFLEQQLDLMEQLTLNISYENFWKVFPEILGIDAKLTLLVELIQFNDFSEEEIIRIIETDYRNYFKELCGFDLNTKTKHSMIFNIK